MSHMQVTHQAAFGEGSAGNAEVQLGFGCANLACDLKTPPSQGETLLCVNMDVETRSGHRDAPLKIYHQCETLTLFLSLSV